MMNRLPGETDEDIEVLSLLTVEERWLYRFCRTDSVSGVSGPRVSVQDLLKEIASLRRKLGVEAEAVKGA